MGGPADGIDLELDGTRPVRLAVRLREGEAVVYSAGGHATVYTSDRHVVETVPVDAAGLIVAPGDHRIAVDAALRGDDAWLRLELRLRGQPESVSRD